MTANIEDLRVGDWVLAHNPELSDAERAEFAQVDPPTWRELTLRMTKADGSRLDIQLLRPLWWIEECGAAPGKTIHLDLAELGAEGPAEVLAVAPCPPISDPPTAGCRVVTGTFAHSSGETLDLHIDGLCGPIGVTANHPFWSEDRQAFVPAGELQVGERLRKADGTLTQVLLLEDRPGVEPVFNLEVEVEHVYFVTPEGILVHNTCDRRPILLGRGMNRIRAVARAKQFDWYKGKPRKYRYDDHSPEAVAHNVKNNERWLREQIRDGRRIYDIGQPKGSPRSDYYDAERKLLRENGYHMVRRGLPKVGGGWYQLFEWVK